MNWLAHLDKPFVLCLGCNTITSLLLWFGKLTDASYLAITLGTTGAYIAGWSYKATKGTPAERAAASESKP